VRAGNRCCRIAALLQRTMLFWMDGKEILLRGPPRHAAARVPGPAPVARPAGYAAQPPESRCFCSAGA